MDEPTLPPPSPLASADKDIAGAILMALRGGKVAWETRGRLMLLNRHWGCTLGQDQAVWKVLCEALQVPFLHHHRDAPSPPLPIPHKIALVLSPSG